MPQEKEPRGRAGGGLSRKAPSDPNNPAHHPVIRLTILPAERRPHQDRKATLIDAQRHGLLQPCIMTADWKLGSCLSTGHWLKKTTNVQRRSVRPFKNTVDL